MCDYFGDLRGPIRFPEHRGVRIDLAAGHKAGRVNEGYAPLAQLVGYSAIPDASGSGLNDESPPPFRGGPLNRWQV
jgi:hypothetical protein